MAPATAHRWWHRRLEASEQELRCGSWLFDRSSRPRRMPRLLERELQERICECRRHTGWGPRLVAGATGQVHSTVWKVLRRHGISRPPRAPKEPANRYEWPCPGDLAWTQALALDGELAVCEPKTLRYRLLHTAARLAFHARRATLRLQRIWPWAPALAAAFASLAALPPPAR